MTSKRPEHSPFPSDNEDAKSAKLFVECPQTRLPNYRLAFQDNDFLLRDELRPVRLQLELMKPIPIVLFWRRFSGTADRFPNDGGRRGYLTGGRLSFPLC